MFRYTWILLLLIGVSCVAPKGGHRRAGKRLAKEIRHAEIFSKGFTGFELFDPIRGQVLCAVQADRYFTPASNTKVLTLLVSLNVLGDSIPALYLQQRGDSLHIQPAGDPTFLHPHFQNWQKAAQYLANAPQNSIWVHLPPASKPTPLGPGWAWDDADEDYSPERSAFPVYGNVRRLYVPLRDSLYAAPAFWQSYLRRSPGPESRIVSGPDNQILYHLGARFQPGYEQWVPVHEVEKYRNALLTDTLHHKFIDLGYALTGPRKTLYACPADTVYRRLMYESDNFIAEQLLLLCAGVKLGTLDAGKIIRWAQDSLLGTLAQKPKWVDGSGLSRYNLNTPHNMVAVLSQLWQRYPHDRLLRLFPSGGVSGTLNEWYKGYNGSPYVFAKTGSMNGVHCLSGYLVTNSGKTLIFSFMHNNFVGSSKPYKVEMQRLLESIKATF